MTTSTYKAGRSQGQSAPAPHSGFALLDGLASVKQIVDSSQAVENSYSYEAFGQATVGQSDVANPYLFVGGYGVQCESTPSLYFMQARYYSPGVGRFISEDPYGGSPQDPLSLHRYLYCANGPVTRTDPSGEFVAITALIGMILIGTIVILAGSGCGVVEPPVETWSQEPKSSCDRVYGQANGSNVPRPDLWCWYARHCLK